MTRDIIDRFETFGVYNVEIVRCALNMDQVEELNPPPSPAKITDSRCKSYVESFGDDSWELDAVSPQQLNLIAEEKIKEIYNPEAWEDSELQERYDKNLLERFINEAQDSL